MGNSFPGSAGSRLTSGRMSGALAAYMWLWTSVGAFTATAAADPASSSPYQRALELFNREDYAHALSLLEQAPGDGARSSRAKADTCNLKGAIYLRQGRYAEARAAFDEAARTDPNFWAAHFNQVEVSFREKRYADSHRQFDELLGHTGRLWHSPERRFIEYKMMLTDLLDGNEKPAADFIAAHMADQPPPLAWYYLSAAREFYHGRNARGEAYLQQVGTNYAPSSEQVYAESFDTLGWSARGGSAERVASRGTAATESASTLAQAAGTSDRKDRRAAAKAAAKTLAVVQLIPEGESTSLSQTPPGSVGPRGATRSGGTPAAHPPAAVDMPPVGAGMNSPANETPAPTHAASPVAGVLARRKAHPTPSPSATPEDSPAAGADSAAASPSPAAAAADATSSPAPSATPSGTPSPAFVSKYEAAMVQFLQKNYPETKRLLDEADAIQPNQPNSVSLRNQLFKQYYEAAYTAYQHSDYAGALTQLDGADGVGSNAQNQSDAYNLRGLVLSKQRNYTEAENMFHKAVQTDPGLWAAKFNYAEVPFNYRNFTVARTRFEELFSQTDPVKQPVEAELTQFKVFLTLLLEGKEDAARTFMQHFNFSGATPARYFCQAALNFYTGDVDKAQGWIDSARKEYPPRKSSSFLEAFYRVGWLTDPNAPAAGVPGTAVAMASPAPTVAPSPATAAASASSALAATTPPVSLAASPSPKPAFAAASPTATPVNRPAALPAVTAFPSAAPTVVAMATPPAAPSPTAPAIAKVPVPTAAPAPTAAVVAMATPRPATSAPAASATLPVSTPAPSPSEAPAESPAVVAQPASSGSDFLRVLVIGAVLLYFLYVVSRIALSAMNPKPRPTGTRKSSAYGSPKTAAADQIEAPRR